MVNFLMKCLDPSSISSELELIIEEMEKCQSDKMAYVKVEGDIFSCDTDLFPTSLSPESRTLDFFHGYESFIESPTSMSHVPQNLNYQRRIVNRKLWSHENGEWMCL
ncbi:hypothetical protein L6164_004835 [Bauhinia variegata]|uniref:Uncharacterized protein n=1 Tax=Bauhinia variegata TaxID=167791 RepID=A0ACB9PPJ3_BAUVA|nr:hypothetical protein L6164_004835 [Bauhinia variegata]